MIQGSTRARRLLGAGATVCLTLAALIGAVSTAQAATRGPAVMAWADVDHTDATVHVAAAYPLKDVTSATCALDGVATGCGQPSAVDRKTTTYSISFTNLAVGLHTFTVDVTVGTGKKAIVESAGTTFESIPTPALNACAVAGGVFSGTGHFGWSCSGPHDQTSLGELAGVCAGSFYADTNSCSTSSYGPSAHDSCAKLPSPGVFLVGGSSWTCTIASTTGLSSADLWSITGPCMNDGGRPPLGVESPAYGELSYVCSAA